MTLFTLFLPAINNSLYLAQTASLLPLAAAGDSTHPPVVPNRQYWGTFYYPWYGDGELPPLELTKDPTSPLLVGHTEPEVIRVDTTFYLYYRTDSAAPGASPSTGSSNPARAYSRKTSA